jgi:hypothetical protein
MVEPASEAESIYDSVPLLLGDSVYIRVIKIRQGAETERVACDFSILDVNNGSLYDLDTASPLPESCEYTALSYTWGQAIADHTIELNGTPFLIRRNLWNFLLQARISRCEGYLWIDALCIDQARVGERNHQVGLMGNIYSNAEKVIVWLGNNNARVQNAMVALQAYLAGYSSANSLTQHHDGMWELCDLEYCSRAWM